MRASSGATMGLSSLSNCKTASFSPYAAGPERFRCETFLRQPGIGNWMSILSDLRFGARMIIKRPGTSALAIIALALGIGLTTTMFSIVQGAFLRGLPFPESDRLYHLGRISKQSANPNS